MEWRFPARQRIEALDARVDELNSRLAEVMSRLDRLSDDFDRLSSETGRVRQDLDAVFAHGREQGEQLATVRDAVSELQEHDGRTTDEIAALREGSDRLAEAIADQASRLGDTHGKAEQQDRSLDQIRADITRLERQAAADLAELRTTSTALVRMVRSAQGVWNGAASS